MDQTWTVIPKTMDFARGWRWMPTTLGTGGCSRTRRRQHGFASGLDGRLMPSGGAAVASWLHMEYDSVLEWLWSCDRVREQVRVTVRMRPSCEACTGPRSHEHRVKGGRPVEMTVRCSDGSGETHFDPSSLAELVTSPNVCRQRT